MNPSERMKIAAKFNGIFGMKNRRDLVLISVIPAQLHSQLQEYKV